LSEVFQLHLLLVMQKVADTLFWMLVLGVVAVVIAYEDCINIMKSAWY